MKIQNSILGDLIKYRDMLVNILSTEMENMDTLLVSLEKLYISSLDDDDV
jgi:hypothetical protein